MEYVSNGCYVLTGYNPEDLIGNRLLSYNDLIHPNDRKYVRDNVQAAIDEERQYEIQYRIIRKDGAIRWVFEKGGKSQILTKMFTWKALLMTLLKLFIKMNS